MGYKVYYDEMWEIIDNIKNLNNNWAEGFGKIKKSTDSLMISQYLKGDGAENIKAYIGEVHINLIAQIYNLFALIDKGLEIYRGGYQLIDDGDGSDYGIRYTTMVEDELSDGGRVSKNINTLINLNSSIRWEVNDVRQSIRDLISLAEPVFTDQIEEMLNKAKAIATNLNDDIKKHESEQANGLDEVIAVIQELTNIAVYQNGISRVPMASYTPGKYAEMCNYERLKTASESIVKKLESKEFNEAYDKAIANTFDRQALLKEEREKKAKAIKWAVTGLCIVASVVVTVATAGTAGPLVLGIVGGVTAAVSTGTEILTDEYVEKGNLNSVDWGDFTAKVAISGAIGFAAGAAGGAAGSAIKGPSTISQTVGKKMLAGLAENAIESTGSYLESGLHEVVDGVSNGKIKDIKGAVTEIFTGENLQEYGKNLLIGSITTVVDTGADELVDAGGKKIFKNWDDGLKKDIGKAAYKTIAESGGSVVTNSLEAVGKETYDHVVKGDEFNVQDIKDSIKKEVANDFGKGLIKNSGDVIGEHKRRSSQEYRNERFEDTIKGKSNRDDQVEVVEYENGITVLKSDYDAAMEATSKEGYEGKSARELLGLRSTKGEVTVRTVDKDDLKNANYYTQSKIHRFKIKE